MSKPGLPDVIGALRGALDEAKAPYMLIGGLAVIVRGVARLTRDVDATIWAENLDLRSLIDLLQRHGLEGRIPDAEEFARRHFVLLLRHERTRTPVDLSLAWVPFERAALDRAEEMDIEGTRVRVAAAADLIVYKAVAWRPRDQEDIERLAAVHARNLDVDQILRYVAEFAEVLDEPGRTEDVKRLILRHEDQED